MPLNLIARSESKKALYVETDAFSTNALQDAGPYGDIQILATSKATILHFNSLVMLKPPLRLVTFR